MNLNTITRSSSKPGKPPLLFVHGMWHGAWCWDEHFLPFFAEHGYPATAVSLRGHSGSEGKIGGSSISDFVADVEQIAKTFATPPVVIGHSMGGFTVQKYLETNPAPAGVLLASVPPSGAWSATARVFFHSPWVMTKVMAQLRLFPAVKKPADAKWALFSEDFPEAEFMKHHPKLEDESFRAYLDLLGLNLVSPQKISAPMLVLRGESDHIISAANAQSTAERFNTTPHFFPNMAHDMMLESGWKAVAEKTLSWLKERGI